MLESLSSLFRWLRRDPPAAESTAGVNLSAIPHWIQSGDTGRAEAALQAALAQDANHVDALHFLGLLRHQQGRHAEAVAQLGKAAALRPELSFVRANFAEALRAAGDLAGAEREARQALALDPGSGVAAFNLAAILAARGTHATRSEALELALRVLAAQPDWFEALLLAANLYVALDQLGKAQELLNHARELRPQDPAAILLSVRNRAWMCDWRDDDVDDRGDTHGDFNALRSALEHWAANPADPAYRGLNPFVAYEYPVTQKLRDAVTQACTGQVMARHATKQAATPAASERLRIGYVSADFHNHPTMHLMRRLFGLHDRSRFEVFAYSLGPDDGSAYRREAVRDAEHFVDIAGLAPEAAAGRIRADGIHILLDLKGFTQDAQPGLFALQPAPLRAAWLGYPASTGRGLNDYLIADRVVAPPSSAAHFGEQLVYLPHSYQINDNTQPVAADTPSRASLGLPEQGFVFACFNHVYKIEPRMFAVWMRILEQVPGSVLWLYVTVAEAEGNLSREAAAAGIDPQRLIFARSLPKPEHLARLTRADLFLDTLWINAHTGASDALWAGVPVLTCPQESFPSRVAASLVTAAGLPQLACASLEAYEAMAVQLANDAAALQALRDHLTSQHEQLPLFDTPRFVRNLERAYEVMWRRQVEGLAPQGFEVSE